MYNRKIYILSLALNAIVAIYLIVKYVPKPSPEINIVVSGDSRVEAGNWQQGLDRSDVKNAGIGGLTTTSYLAKIDSSVISYHPDVCIIQLGINDIRQNTKIAYSAKCFEQIIDRLLQKRIKPVITSVIPLRKDFWQDEISETVVNLKADTLNQILIKLCATKHVTYLDINTTLSANGRLKREYTSDGIHLNDSGFYHFYKDVRAYLVKNR